MVGRSRTCCGVSRCDDVGSRSAYGPAVANRPADDAPRVATSTDLQGKNLGRVEPGHRKPGGAEDGGEEEHEEGRGTADTTFVAFGCVLGSAGKATGGEHADALANRAPVEGPAASDAIKREDAEEG